MIYTMNGFDPQEYEDDMLIMPIVMPAEPSIPNENLFVVLATSIIRYFDEEYFEDGHLPEQIFLEWLSDGAKIDLRTAANKNYYRNANENQTRVNCGEYALTFEPVTVLNEASHSFSSLPSYHPGQVQASTPAHLIAPDDFTVPLISIVINDQEAGSFQEILDQVAFTVSSIYFSLGTEEMEQWRENNFRVEVFLEKNFPIPTNSRVLNTHEETGGIVSAGFWID